MSIAILVILIGLCLLLNGVWILFISKKRSKIISSIQSKTFSDLTKSEQNEINFYKIEFFLFKLSIALIAIGSILFLLIALIKGI